MKNKELIVDNGKLAREDWEHLKLKDVTKVIGGGTPKTSIKEYWSDDVVWLSPTDLPEIGEIVEVSDSIRKISNLGLKKSSAKLLPIGTVCFSSRASIGKIGISKVELATNQGFKNFVCKENLYNKFLAYALKFLTPKITGLSNSTTFKEISTTAIKNVEIPLPPLPEQRRIVSKLDGLFAEIDASLALIDQNIEQAEALKLSVLDEEFGVKGKSWSNLTKVGKVLSAISTGTTPSKKIKDYYNSDDIEWFKPADFDDKRKYLKESRDNLSNKSIKDKKARIFKKDTLLLVAIGATIGKIGLVYKETGSANQQITGMNFKSKIFPEFSYYWFKYIKSTIVRNASSATLPILNQKGIKDLPFNYPDNIDDQQKIVQKLDALFKEIDGLVSDYQQKREDFEAL